MSSALAHPNIAIIKYWGNRNELLRLPSNGSISMNLEGLETITSVIFDDSLKKDEITINGQESTHLTAGRRVVAILDEVRHMASMDAKARVESSNNFPTGTGIASSASAFAALALAATSAAGLNLDQASLSRLARHGSGSACRSIPQGFVEWIPGEGDVDSFALSLASPDHWDLTDCIALIGLKHKDVSSTVGHATSGTSVLQSARVADAPRRLEVCRNSILDRDFHSLASIAELDSNLLHAVMMTSFPPLFYWEPPTLAVMQAVRNARVEGLPVFYTIDAGPNVHVICPTSAAENTSALLKGILGVLDVIQAGVGGPAKLTA